MDAIFGLITLAATVLVTILARLALVVLLIGVVWAATVAVWAPVRGASWLWHTAHGYARQG